MAAAVVSVNSSMFARVPGPADFEEIEAYDNQHYGLDENAAPVAEPDEMVEAATAVPTTMQGRILEDVSRNVDAETFSSYSSTASSSISCPVRSVSGGRTGPQSRPINFMPAFTIDTA